MGLGWKGVGWGGGVGWAGGILAMARKIVRCVRRCGDEV